MLGRMLENPDRGREVELVIAASEELRRSAEAIAALERAKREREARSWWAQPLSRAHGVGFLIGWIVADVVTGVLL